MIIIGDIHGSLKTLKALLAKVPKDEEICFVGDLIDRGPYSAEVVQFIIDNGYYCVKGNHEDLFLHWQGSDYDLWTMNGGLEALESYNFFEDEKNNSKEYAIEKIMKHPHREWMENLPTYIEFKDLKNDEGRYLVVSHSSIGNYWDDRDKKSTQIMWNRDGEIKDIPEIYNVFGHTINEDAIIRKHYANVDTGAFINRSNGKKGKMTALRFPQMEIYTQEHLET